MYHFTTGMIILITLGFGFFQWEVGGFLGKIVALILLSTGVALYFRWEKILFK